MVKLKLMPRAAAIVSAEHQQYLKRVIARSPRAIVGQHAPQSEAQLGRHFPGLGLADTLPEKLPAATDTFGRHIVADIFRRRVDAGQPVEFSNDGWIGAHASEKTDEIRPPTRIHRV